MSICRSESLWWSVEPVAAREPTRIGRAAKVAACSKTIETNGSVSAGVGHTQLELPQAAETGSERGRAEGARNADRQCSVSM